MRTVIFLVSVLGVLLTLVERMQKNRAPVILTGELKHLFSEALSLAWQSSIVLSLYVLFGMQGSWTEDFCREAQLLLFFLLPFVWNQKSSCMAEAGSRAALTGCVFLISLFAVAAARESLLAGLKMIAEASSLIFCYRLLLKGIGVRILLDPASAGLRSISILLVSAAFTAFMLTVLTG